MPAWNSIEQSGIALGQINSTSAFKYPNIPFAVNVNDGKLIAPALCMEKADHQQTQSLGSRNSAKQWRTRQAGFIAAGNFDVAQNMDIADVRGIAAGDKYDLGIIQMQNYTIALRAQYPYLFQPRVGEYT